MPEILFRFGGSIIRGSYNIVNDKEVELFFRYHEGLKDEIKACMGSAKWNPKNKSWIIPNDQRTWFVLDYLQGKNVYANYDVPLIDATFARSMYSHQKDMGIHALTRKQCIIAGEPGVGKTLTAIEVMELSSIQSWWYVAPKSAVQAVKKELGHWKAKIYPRLMTYDELVRVMRNWNTGDKPIKSIIFDECQRLKTPNSQRTQAAQYLTNHMREEYGNDAYIILMSGTPAPKSPLDWFSLCEIVKPGFLREGNIHKFRERLAVMKYEENAIGQKYPKILTFKDNENKCNICGKLRESEFHKTDPFSVLTAGQSISDQVHEFVPSVNEVANMYKRLDGMVLVKLKRLCLDLPVKIYETIDLKPTPSMMRTARLVTKSSPSVAQSLILLRELSDGFQYMEKHVGNEDCLYCIGMSKEQKAECKHCSGRGHTKKYETQTIECDTPKIAALIDELEAKEDDGRLIVYAGFTGSIDRIVKTVVSRGWNYIRVDGRGWTSDLGTSDQQQLLKIFQRETGTEIDNKNIVWVAHPGSSGTGLTLTASDTIIYFSNDFNGDSRMQSEDRIHRIGTRGCIIKDFIHLPVDKLVVDNLRNKKELQSITLGDINKAFEDNEQL